MIKSYKYQSFINGIKFSCLNAFRTNKIKIILTFFFVVIGVSTGVFVAIKSNNDCCLGQLQDICLDDFFSGFTASSSAFAVRCFSLLINAVILILLTLSPYLFFLAEVLFVYRAYLFGLNLTLIFVFYGVSGIVTGIIIVLPCQLLILLAMILFYIILQKSNIDRKKYGYCECNRILLMVVFVIFLFLVNLTETLLLCLLNGKVIMVI